MLGVLHPRQPSMPSAITGQYYPQPAQEPHHLRHPLTQLQSQPPSSRDGRIQGSEWAGHPQKLPHALDVAYQAPNYFTPPNTVTGSSSSAPMLAPVRGGLYRANAASQIVQQQVSCAQSPSSEVSPKTMGRRSAEDGNTEQSSSNESDQIAPYLQIPASINSSKGSLSEFAAQITCLFWFESSFTLHQVEESRNPPAPMKPLVPEAKPTLGFQKWVTTILSTTQVSPNVILLALMFIYRLKKLNPTVKGKPGSEYRLLTVALMLGNKFLDDNTYTNKTWAEVSGITVSEIHIMEVEFLSNMRYNLYVSHQEWRAWHEQLNRFYNYFERASSVQRNNASFVATSMPNGVQSPYCSPPGQYIPSPIRSANQFSTATRFPSHSSNVPSHSSSNVSSPATLLPDITTRPNSRKRSHDGSLQEPQAKRVVRHQDVSNPETANNQRLPFPNVTRPSMQSTQLPSSYSAYLPPPNGRAMSSVYGQHPKPSSDLLKPQSSALPSLGIKIPPVDLNNRPVHSANNSKSSSPIGMVLTPTTELLSPMNYNIHRSSPYRPVRAVNTLLVPPPSASLQNPSQSVGSSDMHYQPLGKQTERRTGVVPYMPQAYPPPSWVAQNPYHIRQ